MSRENIFADEWRECLREHYKNVIQNDKNPRNLESVRKAFLRPNGERPAIFSESELQQFQIEATMRTENMSDDAIQELLAEAETAFTPTPEPTLVDDRSFQPHPLECQCPSCIQINLKPHDDEGQPLDDEAVAELQEIAAFEAKKDDPDTPQQLTLF